MIEKHLPGVWRVGGGSWGLAAHPVLSVKKDPNVYLLQLKEGAVLVDCGSFDGRPIIENNIREAGVAPDDLSDLILTHSHGDHTEAAEAWRTRRSLRTHLNAVGVEHVGRGDTCLLGYVYAGPSYRYEPFRIDHSVEDGEPFEAAGTVIHPTFVPGHTPDSTLFTLELDGQRIAFSGDLCFGPADWDEEPGIIGSLRVLWKSDLVAYRDSLKRVLEMELDVLFPGHGFVVSGVRVVHETVAAALGTIERLLATPKIYAFGINWRE